MRNKRYTRALYMLAISLIFSACGFAEFLNPTLTPNPTATPAATPAPTLTDTPKPTQRPTITSTPAPFVLAASAVPDNFEVSYEWYPNSKKETITETIKVNHKFLMTVPLGLVPEGKFPSVDETIVMMRKRYRYLYNQGETPSPMTINVGVLSGIFINSYLDQPSSQTWQGHIAFPTRNGKWETIGTSFWPEIVLRSVDANMVPKDATGQFFVVDPRTRIQEDRILSDRTITKGDHVLFFFVDADDSIMSSDGMSRRACNNLRQTLAIKFVSEGGMCTWVSGSPFFGEKGRISGRSLGLIYLVTP